MVSCDFPWGLVEREEALAQREFWRFLLCGQISVGETVRSWSLVCAIQAERSQSQLPRMSLSFEWKELWEKIELACDWLVNF